MFCTPERSSMFSVSMVGIILWHPWRSQMSKYNRFLFELELLYITCITVIKNRKKENQPTKISSTIFVSCSTCIYVSAFLLSHYGREQMWSEFDVVHCNMLQYFRKQENLYAYIQSRKPAIMDPYKSVVLVAVGFKKDKTRRAATRKTRFKSADLEHAPKVEKPNPKNEGKKM